MLLYATDTNWAIIFENVGYFQRFHSIEVQLTGLGNCLQLANKDSNVEYISLTDFEELEKLEDGFELINKNVDSIFIRGQKVPVIQDLKEYKSKKITIIKNEKKLIDVKSMIRMCNETNPESFRATEEEITRILPKGMKKLMTINHWHHEHYSKHFGNEIAGKKPSSYETFRLIAKILVNKDANLWLPKLKANNNWRNWTNIY